MAGEMLSGVSRIAVAAAAVAILPCCGSPSASPSIAASQFGAVAPDATKVYQPLAAGDTWTYTCNHAFKIVDRVVRKLRVAKRTVYALSLQIPSSPSKSNVETQLLANDSKGNTWLYGYLIKNGVHTVKPSKIVAAAPVKGAHFNYPGPKGGTIGRIFKEFEYTNQTPLGVFWVAAYFESNATHNYGYSLGRGVMEEDHGPSYKYDCLIEKYTLH